MKCKLKILGTACGLSLLLGNVGLAAWAATAPPASPADETFAQLAKQRLKGVPQAAAALVVVDARGTSVSYAGDMKADSTVHLGRLGELFVSLLALQQIDAGALKPDASANDFLTGYALAQPYGEITVRQLLERSSGLPLREASLYISGAGKIPDLKNLLIQDLKPAVLPPGEAISEHSFGDLVLGEVVANLGKKPLEELIETRLLAPLGLKEIKLPAPSAEDRTLLGHDSSGATFRRLHGSAHVLHDWIARPADFAPLLQALLGKAPQVLSPDVLNALLAEHSLLLAAGLPTTSQGLFEGWQHERHFYYLDSDWFGYTARLLVNPGRQAALLIYNSTDPALKEKITDALLAQIPPSVPLEDLQTGDKVVATGDKVVATVDVAESVPSLPISHPLALRLRDSNSLLKVYNLFAMRDFQAAGPKSLSWRGETWTPGIGGIAANARGQRLSYASGRLDEGFGGHASWYRVGDWEAWPVQLAIAAVFALLFVSVLARSLRFFYEYEPRLENTPDFSVEEIATPTGTIAVRTEASPDTAKATPEASAAPLEEAPSAGLDVPIAATLSASLALVFTAGIYPVMMFADRVGDQSALVVRNEPSGWLIAWLAMPLIALMTALILLAFVSASWKLRPWTRFEKLHYLLLALGVPLWAAWLASWNLLGFRF